MTSGSRAAITITGRVQGVGYRMWVARQAHILRLTGFVKNLHDGSVYLEAEGDPDCVMRIVSICSEGPARSNVSEVTWSLIPIEGAGSFKIL